MEDGSSEDNAFRGERTCKGLRYQKFLAEQLAHQSKQRRIPGLSKYDQILKFTRLC